MFSKLQGLGRITDWIHRKTLFGCLASSDREVDCFGGATQFFFVHLFLICLAYLGLFGETPPDLLADPIAAIYTPFSFILIYEVYLLIFFLPASITQYIAKQYEIIT